MRVQHINHALNPGKCFIFTDFVQCTYFELQQGNGVTARNFNAAKFLKSICVKRVGRGDGAYVEI